MRSIYSLLGYLVAATLFSMMALTFVDVIGRKFFDRSLVGATELLELFMLLLIFAGLPLASNRGEHVIFDLLDQYLTPSLRRLQAVFAELVCSSLMLGGAYLVWVRAARTAEGNDTTANLLIPMAGFHYATAMLLAVGAAVHLGRLLEAARGAKLAEVQEADNV
jgi:TRAP-type transport system small permease protein